MNESFRDRLSMIDEKGSRIPLFPAEVRGIWRRRRTQVHLALMFIFLTLPWWRIGGKQAVLFDLKRGEFHIFGLTFWSHDAPLIFFLLISFALVLALLTTLWGRVWCGWACPQTVFLDGFIRRIERWTEGTHLQRRALDQAPWSLEKLTRRTVKWILFVAFSMLLTHTLLATFIGTENLLHMMLSPPSENLGVFYLAAFLTGVLLFDMTWFREQFCLVMCPYGRFQSVLLDRQSVTVHYDTKRGEPRRGTTEPGGAPQGDCVSCSRCVQVCPTGIDIRNGSAQMECIGCTACIDACDEIMTKVKKPKGLIKYSTQDLRKPNLLRPRVLLYLTLLILSLSGLTIAISNRSSLEVTVLRALDLPYYEKIHASGETYLYNSYRLHLHNQSGESMQVAVDWAEPNPNAELVIPGALLNLKKGDFRMVPIVIGLPKDEMNGSSRVLKLRIQENIHEVQFVGP